MTLIPQRQNSSWHSPEQWLSARKNCVRITTVAKNNYLEKEGKDYPAQSQDMRCSTTIARSIKETSASHRNTADFQCLPFTSTRLLVWCTKRTSRAGRNQPGPTTRPKKAEEHPPEEWISPLTFQRPLKVLSGRQCSLLALLQLHRSNFFSAISLLVRHNPPSYLFCTFWPTCNFAHFDNILKE